ncbi:arylacetamide deacetylase-like [Thamnophis elegans]|uniref:arylacetamide deacetylase-like n=1 Tax=Thamnophis elegans TaxID=35005 RepID=UPI0013768178|nr:arylacetamide deacetylase-like [Thamnophis elegans]
MDVLNLHIIATYTPPTSDEKVIVTDTEFSHVPVRLYIPTKQSDVLKRAVIFIHGGGWCIGSATMKSYDLLSRWTSERLNAVVVSVDYRLAPKYRFPVAFEDVYSVSKYFLQSSILEKYNVDPSRIGIAGDSAGGNLAAAVTQQVRITHLKVNPKWNYTCYLPLLSQTILILIYLYWGFSHCTPKSRKS